jgi:hypothetical protein
MAREVDLRLLRGSSLSQFLGNEEGFAAIFGARWCQGPNSRVCEGSAPQIHCQLSSTHTPGGFWRGMRRSSANWPSRKSILITSLCTRKNTQAERPGAALCVYQKRSFLVQRIAAGYSPSCREIWNSANSTSTTLGD